MHFNLDSNTTLGKIPFEEKCAGKWLLKLTLSWTREHARWAQWSVSSGAVPALLPSHCVSVTVTVHDDEAAFGVFIGDII